MTGIDAWHAYIGTGDRAALHELLNPDATFDSPIVHTTQRGREMTEAYLHAAATVLGGPDFHYTAEWANSTGAVLEFETMIDGVTINGVDIIRFTDDGQRIAAFKVMIRPLKAVNLVHRLMGEQLGRSG